jgi:hypothetical protein
MNTGGGVVKILLGMALLVAGAVAAPAYAADNCIVSQEQLPGAAAADSAKAKITCVYSCPDGKKVTQTIDMSQKKCPATIPAPNAAPKAAPKDSLKPK